MGDSPNKNFPRIPFRPPSRNLFSAATPTRNGIPLLRDPVPPGATSPFSSVLPTVSPLSNSRTRERPGSPWHSVFSPQSSVPSTPLSKFALSTPTRSPLTSSMSPRSFPLPHPLSAIPLSPSIISASTNCACHSCRYLLARRTVSHENFATRISEIFADLADTVTRYMKYEPMPPNPNRFVNCNKSDALINLWAKSLSSSNPYLSLPLSSNQVHSLIAFQLGVQPRQVGRILERASKQTAHCPPCKVAKVMTAQEKMEANKRVFNETTQQELRWHIHDEFAQQRRPTLETMLTSKDQWLSGDDEGRAVSITTLHRALKGMGFRFKKLTTRAHMFISPALASLRNSYLKRMKEVRERTGDDKARNMALSGVRHAYGWVDTFADNQPFIALNQGLTAGQDGEHRRGERLVLVALFSEDGFIHSRVYRTNKNENESAKDYHGEMSAQEYIDEAFRLLVEKAKEKKQKPLLVMDNASYHSRFLSKIPTKSKRKQDFVKFLDENNITFNRKLKKAELYTNVISQLDPSVYNRQAVEEIGKKHGVEIVRLPPYHCLYSPIELGWAWVKGRCKDQLVKEDKGAEAKAKVENFFNDFPKEFAPKYMSYCEKVEQDHIDQGALTFDSIRLSTLEYVRAEKRARFDTDAVPARRVVDGEEEDDEEGEDDIDTSPLLDENGDIILEGLSDSEDSDEY
ncbi:hypothetical protein PRIPAC_98018 [Pristionchus pacificus]|uniref:Tc1-like transposase DDE domain-containing protein n=1 Tax=Pristionchus pacificus TaxID=54126 RepID=A0A2A6BC35_PRIPA|nr:hypothetical protein PRIPAC_98018 [Pristionchus pacificus]|eukprot:PDM63445.1 hypothetical protein PRIPAC_53802 [Pristionchus pacificus]